MAKMSLLLLPLVVAMAAAFPAMFNGNYGSYGTPASPGMYQPSMPSYQPSVPSYQPSMPSYQPSIPSYQPSMPSWHPSTPSYQPSMPSWHPSIPSYQPSYHGFQRPIAPSTAPLLSALNLPSRDMPFATPPPVTATLPSDVSSGPQVFPTVVKTLDTPNIPNIPMFAVASQPSNKPCILVARHIAPLLIGPALLAPADVLKDDSSSFTAPISNQGSVPSTMPSYGQLPAALTPDWTPPTQQPSYGQLPATPTPKWTPPPTQTYTSPPAAPTQSYSAPTPSWTPATQPSAPIQSYTPQQPAPTPSYSAPVWQPAPSVPTQSYSPPTQSFNPPAAPPRVQSPPVWMQWPQPKV